MMAVGMQPNSVSVYLRSWKKLLAILWENRYVTLTL